MRRIVAFKKTSQVRHIGHLDMQRAIQRALRRSGLPIRYSNGFNPHALLSFASPLAVGVAGDEELFEVGVEPDATEEMFRRELPGALPASLPMVNVRLVEDDHPKLMAALMTASYEARMDRSRHLKRWRRMWTRCWRERKFRPCARQKARRSFAIFAR